MTQVPTHKIGHIPVVCHSMNMRKSSQQRLPTISNVDVNDPYSDVVNLRTHLHCRACAS